MSFIATPPPHHSWEEPKSATPITSDNFWPEIDPGEVRDLIRVVGTVSEPRLVDALCSAAASINRELAPWRANQEALGYESLDSVPAPKISSKSVLVQHYLRAIYQLARADLIERYRDFDTTAAGDKQADELTETIDEARRNARWAVLDILGRSHLTAELI